MIPARCDRVRSERRSRSLASDAAAGKTFELVAERGPAPTAPGDFEALFAALAADMSGVLDAIRDAPNLPLDDEPARVRDDLVRFTKQGAGGSADA